MDKKAENILEILKGEAPKNQQKILLECASKIGTDEWAIAVRSLMARVDELNKDKE